MRLNEKQRKQAEENIPLVRFIMKKLNIPYDEDCFQSGCVGLCKAAGLWKRDRAPFSTYACYFIRYEILNYLRRCKKEKRTSENFTEDGFDSCSSDFDQSIRSAENRIVFNELKKLLQRLPSGRDASILMLLAQGRTPFQTARELQVSQSLVYKIRKKYIPFMREWLQH